MNEYNEDNVKYKCNLGKYWIISPLVIINIKLNNLMHTMSLGAFCSQSEGIFYTLKSKLPFHFKYFYFTNVNEPKACFQQTQNRLPCFELFRRFWNGLLV